MRFSLGEKKVGKAASAFPDMSRNPDIHRARTGLGTRRVDDEPALDTLLDSWGEGEFDTVSPPGTTPIPSPSLTHTARQLLDLSESAVCREPELAPGFSATDGACRGSVCAGFEQLGPELGIVDGDGHGELDGPVFSRSYCRINAQGASPHENVGVGVIQGVEHGKMQQHRGFAAP